MSVIAHLAANVSHDSDYSYSFLSDEFVKQWLESGKTTTALHSALKHFVNNYIRNIGKRQWGFSVYHNALDGQDVYSVSFRSLNGYRNVATIAQELGGGGHSAAAGAEVRANSVEEAVTKIKEIIARAN